MIYLELKRIIKFFDKYIKNKKEENIKKYKLEANTLKNSFKKYQKLIKRYLKKLFTQQSNKLFKLLIL